MGQAPDKPENFHCQETRVNIGKRMREQINKGLEERVGPGDKVSWVTRRRKVRS